MTKFMFEADFSDEPQLPSPLQLRHRILIKNKKLMADIMPHPIIRGTRATQRQQQAPRASSIVSNTSGGSLNDEYSDEDEDDDDDDDDNIDCKCRLLKAKISITQVSIFKSKKYRFEKFCS